MKLSNDKREILQNGLASEVLAKMTQTELEDFVYETLLNTYDGLSNSQLVGLIKTFHPELLD